MQTFMEPLTREKEFECLVKTKNGDKEARNELVVRNLRLVAHIAKRYAINGKDINELISIGTIGLIKGIDTFDYEKGNKLVTYVSRCIENEILMIFRSEKKYANDISLNHPVGTDKEGREVKIVDVYCLQEDSVEQAYEDSEDVKWLKNIITKVLSEREQKVMKYRYGLFGRKEYTQKEIGRMLGISRSYVSRIEKKAIEKMRDAYYNI